MTALTTDEKLAQAWARLDQMNSELASVRYLMDRKDDQIRDLRAQVDGLTLANHALREQVQATVVELNAARVRAATSVQDYITQKG